jgi:hypothetical protein
VNAVIGDGKAEQLSFDVSVYPKLWFTISQSGNAACSFNAGPKSTFFTIKSGGEQIWSSRECLRAGLVDKWLVLQPNTTYKTVANEWRKVYSSSTGCGDGQQPVSPGAYALIVEVNSVISENYEQFIIN